MATLHLRNVPADVDAVLTADAKAKGISKNRRAVEAIRRGLGMDLVERSQLVADIRERRARVRVDVAGMIREERPEADG